MILESVTLVLEKATSIPGQEAAVHGADAKRAPKVFSHAVLLHPVTR